VLAIEASDAFDERRAEEDQEADRDVPAPEGAEP
jgi:hypothetical protein